MVMLGIERLRKDLREKMASQTAGSGDTAFREIAGDPNGRPFRLTVFLSPSFLRAVRKQRLQGRRELYSALSNLKYGFDPAKGANPGGKDGIFTVSRDHRPGNDMVTKLYDSYLDTDRGPKELRQYLKVPEAAQGVRVVCHGLRLLGFVEVEAEQGVMLERLVLVDVDVRKR